MLVLGKVTVVHTISALAIGTGKVLTAHCERAHLEPLMLTRPKATLISPPTI
jgi:hypothetical protein